MTTTTTTAATYVSASDFRYQSSGRIPFTSDNCVFAFRHRQMNEGLRVEWMVEKVSWSHLHIYNTSPNDNLLVVMTWITKRQSKFTAEMRNSFPLPVCV